MGRAWRARRGGAPSVWSSGEGDETARRFTRSRCVGQGFSFADGKSEYIRTRDDVGARPAGCGGFGVRTPTDAAPSRPAAPYSGSASSPSAKRVGARVRGRAQRPAEEPGRRPSGCMPREANDVRAQRAVREAPWGIGAGAAGVVAVVGWSRARRPRETGPEAPRGCSPERRRWQSAYGAHRASSPEHSARRRRSPGRDAGCRG